MSNHVRPLTIDDAVDHMLGTIASDGVGPEIETALRRKAEQLLRRVRPYSPGLTSQQRTYLIESGAFAPEKFAETEDRVVRGELRESEQRTSLETIAAGYGESEAAERLGISRDDVRKLRDGGALFAFDVLGIMVYPRWQFTDETSDHLLPYLARVVHALLKDWHPASVQGFMTVAKEELAHRGEWQTPIQWLIRGGSPQPIVAILEGERWR